MKIKSISVYPDDRLAFRACVTWASDDGTVLIDDLDNSFALNKNAKWTNDEELQIALHTGLAMSILQQSSAKAEALGIQQEDYFSAVQEWDGVFILNN